MRYNLSFTEPSDLPDFYQPAEGDAPHEYIDESKKSCMREFDRVAAQIIRDVKYLDYHKLTRSSRVLLCCVFYAGLSAEEQHNVMSEAMTPEFLASMLQIEDIVMTNVRTVQDKIIVIIEDTVEIYYNKRCRLLFKQG